MIIVRFFYKKAIIKLIIDLLIVRFYQLSVTHKNTMRFYAHSFSC